MSISPNGGKYGKKIYSKHKKGPTQGYTGTFGKKITSKKTGKTYTGKEATKKAALRRVKFEHMNK